MYQKKNDFLREWDQVEASAPGRFVLIGDYGDMIDRNAIAIAIDRRLKVTIRPHQDEGKLRLHLKDLNDVREWSTDLPIFTMTKLIAHQSDVLNYNKHMTNRLNPVLGTKYHSTQSEKNSSHTKYDNPSVALETLPTSFSLSSASPLAASLEQSNGTNMQFISRHRQDQPRTYDDNFLLHAETESNRDYLTLREHADKAVTAFFLLYMSLGDSYAKSFRPGLDIEVESTIPMCRGLGSSTAYGTALCVALMKVFMVSAEPTLVTDWAVNIDKFFHNESSSLHSNSVIEGGYIYFQYGKLKACGVPHVSPVKIMLIDTKLRRDPRYVCTKIKARLSEGNEIINGTIGGTLNELASTVWRRINHMHFEPSSIYGSLNIAAETLLMLGLSDKRIHELNKLAVEHRIACKQSQAGETVFLLYDDLTPDIKEFRRKVSELDYEFTDHEMDLEGIRLTVTRRPQSELDQLYEELNAQFNLENHSF